MLVSSVARGLSRLAFGEAEGGQRGASSQVVRLFRLRLALNAVKGSARNDDQSFCMPDLLSAARLLFRVELAKTCHSAERSDEE
jgi:hypothetical protein